MKRQHILLIALTIVFVLLIVGYFAVVRPFVAKDSVTEETEAPETEEGEDLGTSNRFFLFTSLQRSDVESIYVNNEYGEFTFCSTDEGSFYIQDHDGVLYDSELFANLVSVSTYTLSKTKITSKITPEKLAEFGLDNPQAYWIVTDKSGNRFKVSVGNRLLTGGGYYCKFEGRNSVYVLDNTIEKTILVPIEKYVTPVLVAGISQDDYFKVDKFTMFYYDEPMFRIRLVDPNKQKNKSALAENIMDYPTAYVPNSTLYYDVIYSQYMNTCIAGACYKLGATDQDFIDTGLDNPAHTIMFTYHDTEYELYFSELKDSGIYYVVSNLYPDIIGIADGEDFDYLETTLLDWIDKYVFQEYITDISKVEVTSKNVDATFELSHFTTDSGSDDFKLVANANACNEDDVANFRQYYKSLLAVAIYDYCTKDEYNQLTEDQIDELISDENNAFLSFTYTKLDGTTQTLSFYKYSTRHSLVTIDGKGEFYVLTDLIEKIENDTIRILRGETVTAYDKS